MKIIKTPLNILFAILSVVTVSTGSTYAQNQAVTSIDNSKRKVVKAHYRSTLVKKFPRQRSNISTVRFPMEDIKRVWNYGKTNLTVAVFGGRGSSDIYYKGRKLGSVKTTCNQAVAATFKIGDFRAPADDKALTFTIKNSTHLPCNKTRAHIVTLDFNADFYDRTPPMPIQSLSEPTVTSAPVFTGKYDHLHKKSFINAPNQTTSFSFSVPKNLSQVSSTGYVKLRGIGGFAGNGKSSVYIDGKYYGDYDSQNSCNKAPLRGFRIQNSELKRLAIDGKINVVIRNNSGVVGCSDDRRYFEANLSFESRVAGPGSTNIPEKSTDYDYSADTTTGIEKRYSSTFSPSNAQESQFKIKIPSDKSLLGGLVLDFIIAGDFDAANEYVDVYADNTFITKLKGGRGCGQGVVKSKFTIPYSQTTSLTADKEIVIKMKNSPHVSGCTSSQRAHTFDARYQVSSQPRTDIANGSSEIPSSVLMNCTSMVAGYSKGKCTVFAQHSDGQKEDITKHIKNWRSDKPSLIKFKGSGEFTVGSSTKDEIATIKGDYPVQGRSSPFIPFDVTKITGSRVYGLRNLRWECPDNIVERARVDCYLIATINGRDRKISYYTRNRSVKYSSSSPLLKLTSTSRSYATAGFLSSDVGVIIRAEYTYRGVTLKAEKIITLKNKGIPNVSQYSDFSLTCPSVAPEKSIATCQVYGHIKNSTGKRALTNEVSLRQSGSFASIAPNGKITIEDVAKNEEIIITATIKAADGPVIKTAMIQVKDNPVKGKQLTSISLQGCTGSIMEGDSKQCKIYGVVDRKWVDITNYAIPRNHPNYPYEIDSSGFLNAKSVDKDTRSGIFYEYSLNGIKKTAYASLYIKKQLHTVQEIELKPVTKTKYIGSVERMYAVGRSSSTFKFMLPEGKRIKQGTGAVIKTGAKGNWSSTRSSLSVFAEGKVINDSGRNYSQATQGCGKPQALRRHQVRFNNKDLIKAFNDKNFIAKLTNSAQLSGCQNAKDRLHEVALEVELEDIAPTYTSYSLESVKSSSLDGFFKVKIENSDFYNICSIADHGKCIFLENDQLKLETVDKQKSSAQWTINYSDKGYLIKNREIALAYLSYNSDTTTKDISEIYAWGIDEDLSTDEGSSYHNETVIPLAGTVFSFLNASNSNIKLTIGENSEWVLFKDAAYGTDAYKICEQNRPNYCLNIELNDNLQTSKIHADDYSALWDIKKLTDGHLAIRSKWKPNKFISINNSGLTLTNNKPMNNSRAEKPKSLVDHMLSFFISTANADAGCVSTTADGGCIDINIELQFGEFLSELLETLGAADKWRINVLANNVIKIGNGGVFSSKIGLNSTLTAIEKGGHIFAGWVGITCSGSGQSQLSKTCTTLSSAIGTNPIKAIFVDPEGDEDGDGLLNRWEIEGTYINGSYTGNLRNMGVDPLRKDILVHIDYMERNEPSHEDINQVIESFANAPITNQYERSGINLYIDWENSRLVKYKEHLGNQHTGAVQGILDDVYSNYFHDEGGTVNQKLVAKNEIFRYALYANKIWGSKEGEPVVETKTGVAPNDRIFIVSLNEDFSDLRSPATFMHELGHTLGLKHGGGDNLNYKPNYLSIMNYSFQRYGLVTEGNKLDYSRHKLNTLDESSLSEMSGIKSENGDNISYLGTYYFCENAKTENDNPHGFKKVKVGGLSSINWDCYLDDQGMEVRQDINDDGNFDVLSSFNDWNFISSNSLKMEDHRAIANISNVAGVEAH